MSAQPSLSGARSLEPCPRRTSEGGARSHQSAGPARPPRRLQVCGGVGGGTVVASQPIPVTRCSWGGTFAALRPIAAPGWPQGSGPAQLCAAAEFISRWGLGRACPRSSAPSLPPSLFPPSLPSSSLLPPLTLRGWGKVKALEQR